MNYRHPTVPNGVPNIPAGSVARPNPGNRKRPRLDDEDVTADHDRAAKRQRAATTMDPIEATQSVPTGFHNGHWMPSSAIGTYPPAANTSRQRILAQAPLPQMAPGGQRYKEEWAAPKHESQMTGVNTASTHSYQQISASADPAAHGGQIPNGPWQEQYELMYQQGYPSELLPAQFSQDSSSADAPVTQTQKQHPLGSQEKTSPPGHVAFPTQRPAPIYPQPHQIPNEHRGGPLHMSHPRAAAHSYSVPMGSEQTGPSVQRTTFNNAVQTPYPYQGHRQVPHMPPMAQEYDMHPSSVRVSVGHRPTETSHALGQPQGTRGTPGEIAVRDSQSRAENRGSVEHSIQTGTVPASLPHPDMLRNRSASSISEPLLPPFDYSLPVNQDNAGSSREYMLPNAHGAAYTYPPLYQGHHPSMANDRPSGPIQVQYPAPPRQTEDPRRLAESHGALTGSSGIQTPTNGLGAEVPGPPEGSNLPSYGVTDSRGRYQGGEAPKPSPSRPRKRPNPSADPAGNPEPSEPINKKARRGRPPKTQATQELPVREEIRPEHDPRFAATFDSNMKPVPRTPYRSRNTAATRKSKEPSVEQRSPSVATPAYEGRFPSQADELPSTVEPSPVTPAPGGLSVLSSSTPTRTRKGKEREVSVVGNESPYVPNGPRQQGSAPVAAPARATLQPVQSRRHPVDTTVGGSNHTQQRPDGSHPGPASQVTEQNRRQAADMRDLSGPASTAPLRPAQIPPNQRQPVPIAPLSTAPIQHGRRASPGFFPGDPYARPHFVRDPRADQLLGPLKGPEDVIQRALGFHEYLRTTAPGPFLTAARWIIVRLWRRSMERKEPDGVAFRIDGRDVHDILMDLEDAAREWEKESEAIVVAALGGYPAASAAEPGTAGPSEYTGQPGGSAAVESLSNPTASGSGGLPEYYDKLASGTGHFPPPAPNILGLAGMAVHPGRATDDGLAGMAVYPGSVMDEATLTRMLAEYLVPEEAGTSAGASDYQPTRQENAVDNMPKATTPTPAGPSGSGRHPRTPIGLPASERALISPIAGPSQYTPSENVGVVAAGNLAGPSTSRYPIGQAGSGQSVGGPSTPATEAPPQEAAGPHPPGLSVPPPASSHRRSSSGEFDFLLEVEKYDWEGAMAEWVRRGGGAE